MRLAAALACVVGASGCSGVDSSGGSGDALAQDGHADQREVASDPGDEQQAEFGIAEQGLGWFDYFDFKSTCSDPDGTNSAMAALAVATAVELKRWQPIFDFGPNFGFPNTVQLTALGKTQCVDKHCPNVQALLDLQKAPGRVRIGGNIYLDPSKFRKALWNGGLSQFWSRSAQAVPAHKLELVSTVAGGCDQFYWFKATTPTGGLLSSTALSSLQHMLVWADAKTNPYINYQVNGPLIGIDPTYGLNERSSVSAGSCSAACVQMSSTRNLAGSCCSCGGATKSFKRSSWNATTYVCQ